MARREFEITAEEPQKEAARNLLDAISQAGARAKFDIVDELVPQIEGLPGQDFVCESLNLRLAVSKNNNRRDALATALAYAKPESEEVQEKVFERTMIIIWKDNHGPTVIWAAVTAAKFLKHPEYGQRAKEFLKIAREKIKAGAWQETRDNVVSKRREVKGLI